MGAHLESVARIVIAVFMIGNLLEMGLLLTLTETRSALRDIRFTSTALVWAFVVGPALAVVLTRILPLERPYAIGLLLLAMAPCAPALPAAVARARGDAAHAAAFMLLACAGTAIVLPLAVPVLVEGSTADAWTIARPMLSLIVTPLLAGIVIRAESARVAARLQPVVRTATVVATLMLLVVVTLMHGGEFVGAVGTYAIAAQMVFLGLTTAGAYVLAGTLPESQRSVLALGLCTRNIGAAAAPLYAAAGIDRRAVVMVALAVPTTVMSSVIATRWLARRAEEGCAPDGGQR
jgi:BASS family bile acid:Na+ symporter